MIWTSKDKIRILKQSMFYYKSEYLCLSAFLHCFWTCKFRVSFKGLKKAHQGLLGYFWKSISHLTADTLSCCFDTHSWWYLVSNYYGTPLSLTILAGLSAWMLFRLVGCPPFWHRKQMTMLRNIMDGNYSFTSPEWSDITGQLLANFF